MLVITVHGQMWFKNDKDKGKRPFALTVKAPDLEYFKEFHDKYLGTDDKGEPKYATREITNVRGRLKKQLVPLLLRPKYPDFVRVAAVIIDSIETDKGKEIEGLDIKLMSKKQLKAYCADHKIPVYADEYLEIDDFRKDVHDYLEDAKAYLRDKERKSKRRQADNEFLRMNGLLEEDKSARGIAGL